MKFSQILCTSAFLLAIGLPRVAWSQVSVTAAFPGGNILVDKTEGNTHFLSPDLRGGGSWFYWYFEAKAAQPGTGKFVLPSTRNIGVRGPAISTDGGVTWKWLGIEKVEEIPNTDPTSKVLPKVAFSHTFTRPNETIRFSVGIPYVQSHFDTFLAPYKGNKHLTRSVLTQSGKGRDVELLQVGQPGPGKKAVLLTARHHACEALASYVMEGFLTEALGESPAARKFRENYVLYAVPFADKDGVEDGDQGKNRAPHDHNRDYGDAPKYSEIQAIQKLADTKQISLSMDLHCPALKGDVHEAFHFLGLGVPHVKENLGEWVQWFSEEKPQELMTPLMYLADASKPNALDRRINSHYFAVRENSMLSATLEIPYSQPTVELNADRARAYGKGMLKAWNRTVFLPAQNAPARGLAAHAELAAWRKSFATLWRSTPKEAEKTAAAVLADATAPDALKAEANIGLAQMNLWQKKPGEALKLTDSVLKGDQATVLQVLTAWTVRLRALALDPATSPEVFEQELRQAKAIPYPSAQQTATFLVAGVDLYEKRGDLDKAIQYAREWFPEAPNYEKGKVLLRIAAMQDAQKQPEKALATRKETVEMLRKFIGPVPARNVFSATMTVDHFDAIMAIPTSTLEEKKAAAALVLNHEVTAKAYKDRVRAAMEALEGGTAAQ